MVVLRWLWTETGKEKVAPKIIYYTLRGVMFILSFVLEDWAIHDLVHSPRQRRIAVLLVSSSYVTWTYQTHTFSNSIETLVVLWSVVLVQRILENKQRSSVYTAGILGSLVVFGIFNRVTFPAFVLVPGVYLIPHFTKKPFTLLALLLSAFLTIIVALLTDHAFHRPSLPVTHILNTSPTPLRSLLYNLSSSNLSTHGLHPRYNHFLINIPLLLGPSIPLLLTPPYSPRLLLPFTATLLLTLIPHQEPRFLLPAIPLFLSSVRLPSTRKRTRIFIGTWLAFNVFLGILMGIFHQGGVIPMQIWLGEHQQPQKLGADILWWRTYSPPVWLLDGKASEAGLQTIDLMGMPAAKFLATIESKSVSCTGRSTAPKEIIVVAPRSSTELDPYRAGEEKEWRWEELWTEWRHLNLDDMEWAEEGVSGTLRRVVGRRGLTAWRVGRICV
ncbi:alpha 1,2 mannosyltransferase [Lambiella insularis]|nr:alpha 1,2 mannosyltransferase [Lambiella insularis]